MARYKDYSYEQSLLIPVSLSKQVLPGTFEYALNTLIDSKLDLSVFTAKYRNDETGAPAYDPAVLLKIILYAYSKGIISSRKIEQLTRENVVCMALSADAHPHYTTIADFICSMDTACVELFTRILSICYTENLIGKTMFAVDGCKLSSNCSKEWSGTKAELLSKVEKIRKAVNYLVTKHKESDSDPDEEAVVEKEKESIKRLSAKADKISAWLDAHEDRLGAQGKPVKSNITDNESAKMATSHGVIQGYNGIAAVDSFHQTIVWAEAYGDSNESGHLKEILSGIEENCRKSAVDPDILKNVRLTADSGFHSEANMQLLCEREIDGYIADNLFRKRDVRFNEVGKYKKRIAEWQPSRGKKYYSREDFFFDAETGHLVCPAGHPMWLKCRNFQLGGGRYKGKAWMGHIRNCMSCAQRAKCLRKETTKARQVVIFDPQTDGVRINYSALMCKRFDTPRARSIYSQRMGTVEPVFGHIAGTKKLNRFTLRGKKKVNTQWLLYCIVHNIGKLQRFGRLR